MIFHVVKWYFTSSSDISRRQVIFHVGKWYFTSASTLGNTREIRDKFHFYAIHFLWERKSAMVLIYIYIYMYIRIAFSIQLQLRLSRSLRSLANYRPSPLAQKPSNGVLACGDPPIPYIYLITLIPRNITSQLQCICARAAGTRAILVTD